MKENIDLILKMEKEHKNTKMEIYLQDNGAMEKKLDKENLFILMEINMKVGLLITNSKEKEN